MAKNRWWEKRENHQRLEMSGLKDYLFQDAAYFHYVIPTFSGSVWDDWWNTTWGCSEFCLGSASGDNQDMTNGAGSSSGNDGDPDTSCCIFSCLKFCRLLMVWVEVFHAAFLLPNELLLLGFTWYSLAISDGEASCLVPNALWEEWIIDQLSVLPFSGTWTSGEIGWQKSCEVQ